MCLISSMLLSCSLTPISSVSPLLMSKVQKNFEKFQFLDRKMKGERNSIH
jgi:hypothetical protein